MNKVNICGIPFIIEDKDYISFAERGLCLGLIHHDSGIIEMNKNQSKEIYHQTLIHEITHGMLTLIGRDDLSNDEAFVQSLSLAINQTFEIKGAKMEMEE